MLNTYRKINSADPRLGFAKRVYKHSGLCDVVVESPAHAIRSHGASREAALTTREADIPGSVGNMVATAQLVRSKTTGLTRAAAVDGRTWLAADCTLLPDARADVAHPTLDPSRLSWDSKHELYYWPNATGKSPSFAHRAPSVGDAIAMTVTSGQDCRIAVGTVCAIGLSPFLAVTGGKRHRSTIVLVDYDSRPGDCGSAVSSIGGVVGLHCGTMVHNGRRYNAYYPFKLRGLPEESSLKVLGEESSCARQSDSAIVKRAVHVRALPPVVPVAQAKGKKQNNNKKSDTIRESGIVNMSAAGSDLPGTSMSSRSGSMVRSYIDSILNPWGSHPIRLPDHVVQPTALGRFFANRTYTIANTGTVGTNFLFGLNSRISNYTPASEYGPVEQAGVVVVGAATGQSAVYTCGSPGSILNPLQWGKGAYFNPKTLMQPFGATVSPDRSSVCVWSDDFGDSSASSTPFMSAYRVLSMAIRIRIVGLPTGQFMTPGKIYCAQIRYDHTDLPVTEQDFVALEQLGRASHVSADAVRAAGSKTLFFTPDGAQKMSMISNFIAAPGVFTPRECGLAATAPVDTTGVRLFPPPSQLAAGTDFTRAIVPYRTNAAVGTGSSYFSRGIQSSQDSANADSTTLLMVAYFGAADGVVLEVDYAQVVEYIPNKSAPGGIDTQVQLPNSGAMDEIFAAAAVLCEAKPVMFQQPGDLSIVSTGRGDPNPATREASSARNKLSAMATQTRGKAYREGFWDFDWLKSGNVGPVSWDFRDNAGGSAKSKSGRRK